MIKGNAVTGDGWGVARSCAPRQHSGSTASWEKRVEAGKRLLIVDDEPDILHMLKEFFEMEGYATRCASSAEEALGIVKRVHGARGGDRRLRRDACRGSR